MYLNKNYNKVKVIIKNLNIIFINMNVFFNLNNDRFKLFRNKKTHYLESLHRLVDLKIYVIIKK